MRNAASRCATGSGKVCTAVRRKPGSLFMRWMSFAMTRRSPAANIDRTSKPGCFSKIALAFGSTARSCNSSILSWSWHARGDSPVAHTITRVSSPDAWKCIECVPMLTRCRFSFPVLTSDTSVCRSPKSSAKSYSLPQRVKIGRPALERMKTCLRRLRHLRFAAACISAAVSATDSCPPLSCGAASPSDTLDWCRGTVAAVASPLGGGVAAPAAVGPGGDGATLPTVEPRVAAARRSVASRTPAARR
mmetsp:Transcript_44906/g.138545  ORF Transcript_44906/g.138545 Transcript_44906/m.138545 type:complete len:247 (-) Transcript_44906:158-898(-)